MSFQKFVDGIAKMKNSGSGLMSFNQYVSIGYVISIKSPCNLLVFGLGDESSHWQNLNRGGKTVFLEDDETWIQKFEDDNLNVHHCEYTTLAKDHEAIRFDEEKLKLCLPEEVENVDWDIVIVDAPLGHGPPGRPYKGPGRMQSIYAASTLLKDGGICIVDDCGRLIEAKYSSHYFGKENLINLVEEKVAIYKKQ